MKTNLDLFQSAFKAAVASLTTEATDTFTITANAQAAFTSDALDKRDWSQWLAYFTNLRAQLTSGNPPMSAAAVSAIADQKAADAKAKLDAAELAKKTPVAPSIPLGTAPATKAAPMPKQPGAGD